MPQEINLSSYSIPAGGGTFNINLNDGEDSTIYYRFTGNVTLTSNFTIAFTGATTKPKRVVILYDGTIDINGNTITIFGVQLSEEQAAGGNVVIEAVYDGTTKSIKLLDAAQIMVGKRDIITLPLSFETGEIIYARIDMDYDGYVQGIYAQVTKDIENSDDATIDCLSLVTNYGTITLPAGTAAGGIVPITPATNNTFSNGGYLIFQCAKTTPGGKCTLVIQTVRT